jgi:hypothetical protein
MMYTDVDDDGYYGVLTQQRTCSETPPLGYLFVTDTQGPIGKDCNDDPQQNGSEENTAFTFNAIDKNADGRFQNVSGNRQITICATEDYTTETFRNVNWQDRAGSSRWGQSAAEDERPLPQGITAKPGVGCPLRTVYTDNDADGYYGTATEQRICEGRVPLGYHLENPSTGLPRGKDCNDDPKTGRGLYQLLPYNAIDSNGDYLYRSYIRNPMASKCSGSRLPDGLALIDWSDKKLAAQYGQSAADDAKKGSTPQLLNKPFSFDGSDIPGHSVSGTLESPLQSPPDT